MDCCQGFRVHPRATPASFPSDPVPRRLWIELVTGLMEKLAHETTHGEGIWFMDAALKEKLGAQQCGMAREGSHSSSLQLCQIKLSIKSVLWGCRSLGARAIHRAHCALHPPWFTALAYTSTPFHWFLILAGVCHHPLQLNNPVESYQAGFARLVFRAF